MDKAPPERCPRPLYSRDSTQEGHTIPHHHQSEELKDLHIEIKEEEEERLVSGDQQSMEEGEMITESEQAESSLHMDTNGNPPERSPRPLYSQDSTQEGHTTPHHHQSEELKDLNIKIKDEDEDERLVSGDQQSMEEGEVTIKSEREDSSLYIDTSGHYARNISEKHSILPPGRNTNYNNPQHFPGVNFIIQNTQRSTYPSNSQKSSDVPHTVTSDTPPTSHGMERSSDPSNPKKSSLHTGESSLSCSVCGKSFSKNKDLLNHQKTHTERSYPCSKCGICFAKESHLLTHQKFHMGKPPYLCSECGKSFSQKNNFLIHQRIHTGERPYSCSECGKKFSRIEELQKHQKVHTGGHYAKNISENHPILYPGRNANYNNPQHLPGVNFIIQNTQRSTDPSSPQESSHVSHTVTSDTPSTSHGMERSSDPSNPEKSSLPTGESSLSCSVCGKSFSKNKDLLNHQKTHTERSYPCSKCGIRFAKEEKLLTHQKFHMNKPSYSCSECGKSFSQENDFLLHQRIHTGERPSPCSECGKSFSRIKELKKHQKVHKGERPYKCSECGKCFSQREGLLAHQKIHTGGKPYSC